MRKIVQWVKDTFVGSTIPTQTIILPPDTCLLNLEGFAPKDFLHGIEILNDNTTPMEFVVSALRENTVLNEASAVQFMLKIHEKGGAILKMDSQREASTIAAQIQNEASLRGVPLICRAISAQQSIQPDRREDAAPS